MDRPHRTRTGPPSGGRRAARTAVGVPVVAASLVIGMVGACSATGTSGPSLPTGLPSSSPSSLPSSLSSGGNACLGSGAMAVISQVQAYSSEATSILAANKDALISGLQAFQPSDATTAAWRDQLVSALQAGDLSTAASKIRQVGTSGITLQSC